MKGLGASLGPIVFLITQLLGNFLSGLNRSDISPGGSSGKLKRIVVLP